MGNSASSQPVQLNIQGLVIEEADMTILNLHNNTLTYILGKVQTNVSPSKYKFLSLIHI